MTARAFPAFDAGEVNRIRRAAEKLLPYAGSVTGYHSHAVRACSVAWMSPKRDDFAGLWDKLVTINAEFYHFALDAQPLEPLQYTLYGEEDHYGWHMDCGPAYPRRKLSFSLQLSDPAEYEGGELEIWTGAEPSVMPKEEGTLVAFPSYLLHRVRPVTKGVRRALVMWANGEPFR